MSLLLALSLASCESNTKKIDLFLYDQADTFVSLLSNTLNDTLGSDYKINTFDAKRSQSNQNKQIINQLETNNPDVLLVNMVDRLASVSVIQKANITNTPVIFFNREPVYSDIIRYPNAYYVGTNPNQEGKNQGIMAETLMGDPSNINKNIDKNGDNKLQCVFIQGEPGHQDTEKRTYACINYLQQKGYELDILSMESAEWNRDNGKTVMNNIYTKYKDNIEFIFSNNDDMALGAADFILDNNLYTFNNGKIVMPFPIVGVDGTTDGINAIKDGLLYGTTINDSEMQAKAISMLIKLIHKEISVDDLKKEFEYGEKAHYIYVSGSLISQDSFDLKI